MGMNRFDCVLRNAILLDGTGAAPQPGDLALKDGLIAAVGSFDGKGREEIDAEGGWLPRLGSIFTPISTGR